MILGTRLYYRFLPDEVADEALFQERMDALCREIGDRAQQQARVQLQEAVPPARSVVAPAPAPAARPAAAAAPAVMATPQRTGSFTPSLQLSSPAGSTTVVDRASVTDILLSQQRLMLEREDRLRQEAKADLDLKIKELEVRLTQAAPAEAISERQLGDLSARLEALHAAGLLTEDELNSLEDLLADYLELKASYGGTVTLEIVQSNEVARGLLKLVGVSEGLAADAAFARQCRRKFC
jgi:hypothetical protein